MTAIPGTVIGSKIVPSDTADTYPTHEDIYGKGGLISVADSTARNAIPNDRCKEGMLVVTQDDGQVWRLKDSFSNPTVDGDWENNVDIQNTSPSLTLTNTTEENADGGRESYIYFKGFKADGTGHTLAYIKTDHKGYFSSNPDNEEARMKFYLNDSNSIIPIILYHGGKAGGVFPYYNIRFGDVDNDICDMRFVAQSDLTSNNAYLQLTVGDIDYTTLVDSHNNKTQLKSNATTFMEIVKAPLSGAIAISSTLSTIKKLKTTNEALVDNQLYYTPLGVNVVAGTGLDSTVRSLYYVDGNGSAVTVTATPSIAAGLDGQIIYIQGRDDTDTVTLQDESSLSGSKLKLNGGANCVLGKGDMLQLIYNSTDGFWYEISRSNN